MNGTSLSLFLVYYHFCAIIIIIVIRLFWLASCRLRHCRDFSRGLNWLGSLLRYWGSRVSVSLLPQFLSVKHLLIGYVGMVIFLFLSLAVCVFVVDHLHEEGLQLVLDPKLKA